MFRGNYIKFMQFRIGLLQSSVFMICFEKGARCHSRNFERCKSFGERSLVQSLCYAMLK